MERLFEYATIDGRIIAWRTFLMIAVLIAFAIPFFPEIAALCTYLKEAAQ